jgi:hypothetical protein
MGHTFDTVDEKVGETEFFLRKMSEVSLKAFELNCYLSAYLSAARTTTLALQQFKHLPGFDEWYKPHSNRLKENPLAKFFLKARNDHVHGGPYPVSGSSSHKGKTNYLFTKSDDAKVCEPQVVVSACFDYFVLLLEIVYDCYVQLGIHIDPQQYYTKEHFATMGWDIEQAESEIHGWVCTSLIEEGFDEDDRWHELRARVGKCKINHLFYSYLEKVTPQPTEPEHFQDFEYTPEEKGWTHPPAGFESIEAYRSRKTQERASA